MSKLLAVEWDSREIRVAVARLAAKTAVVEEAFAVPIRALAETPPDERTPSTSEEIHLAPQGDATEVTLDDIARRLGEVCLEKGIGRCPALVGVPRAKTELRVLQVPPSPDEELPEMVRFQAMRQFSTLGEDWPLDFMPLASGDDQQTRVLAAAISPKVAADLQRVCAGIDAHDSKLILRPCASASLYGRGATGSQCQLLVELFSEEADLNVVVRGQVVFLRTVRLASGNFAAGLVGEIRRTLAAAQNQLGDQRIEGVTLVGNDAELQELRTVLEKQLDLPIETFDPFSQVQVAAGVASAAPGHPGRFASLLGMLLDEAEGRRHGIDFLNPRRRPPPPDRRQRYTWVAAAAAALVLLVVAGVWWRIHQYELKLKDLQTQDEGWDEKVTIANQLKTDVALVDRFQDGNVNWLNEIYELSQELPDSGNSIVDMATFTTSPGGGGQIALEGYVSGPEVITDMESRLRDARHQVTGSGTHYDERRQDFHWGFKERIVILPEVREESGENE
jgi:Tfp pilus assembly PilM family ATPase